MNVKMPTMWLRSEFGLFAVLANQRPLYLGLFTPSVSRAEDDESSSPTLINYLYILMKPVTWSGDKDSLVTQVM